MICPCDKKEINWWKSYLVIKVKESSKKWKWVVVCDVSPPPTAMFKTLTSFTISSQCVLDYPEWEPGSYQLSMFQKFHKVSVSPHHHICVLRHSKYQSNWWLQNIEIFLATVFLIFHFFCLKPLKEDNFYQKQLEFCLLNFKPFGKWLIIILEIEP